MPCLRHDFILRDNRVICRDCGVVGTIASGLTFLDGPAIELIAAERANQILNGHTPTQDDTHIDGSLLSAASHVLYDLEAGITPEQARARCRLTQPWWENTAGRMTWKYAADPMRRLVIAAALLAAEIERLQRAQLKEAIP